MNSSFIVGNDCYVILPYGAPCPPANTTSSAFTNLHRGILATTFDPSRTFSVSDATFTGTNCGIRMEGIQDAAIHRNAFEVPEPESGDQLVTESGDELVVMTAITTLVKGSGAFSGEKPAYVLSKALAWWDKELSELEQI